MSVRYRVGLDVGTASMGLVAVSLDDAGSPVDIIHHDLRIWNEPLVPKTGTLLNQDRRAKRLHRRQIRRRARRMRGIAHLAPLLGLDADSILASNDQRKNGERVLELRAKAVTERLELEDLLRIMLLLSKKRGYKGTFKEPKVKKIFEEELVPLDESVDQVAVPVEADIERAKETKQVKDGIGRLSEELAQRDGITVGQYIYQEHLADPSKNLKFGKDHSGFYASRAMIEDEFNRIWEKQREFHSAILDKEYPAYGSYGEDGSVDLTPRPLKELFFHAVLHQRPVVWDAGTIGRCQLEPDLPRASMAQPSAQSFRIEKNIADLRWRGAGREERLTHQQNAVIRELLHDPEQMDVHGVVSFTHIYDQLVEKGIRGIGVDGAQTFTKDRSTRGHTEGSSRLNGLIGERTRKAFDRLGILNEWLALNSDPEAPDSRTQVQIINFLSGLTSVEEIGGTDTDCASRFEPTIRSGKKKNKKRTINPQVVEFINKIHATGKLDLLGKMGFDTARSAYSIRANRILANYMKAHDTDETDAKCRAYQKCTHSEAKTFCPQQSVDLREVSAAPEVLQRPASTGNQIVDLSLEQIYRSMQELISKHGMPAEIHIELARDMKLSAKGRREIERDQRDKAKNREGVIVEIRKLGEAPSGKNIDKYLLARDMGNKCPYCRRTLAMEDILSESATEFEHILPRSRSGVGKKNLAHSLLACKSCNSKKDNRLAWDAFADSRDKLERSAEELSPGIVAILQGETGTGSKGKKGKKSKKVVGASVRARIMENKARWLLQQSFEEVQDSESSIDSVAVSAAGDTSWISKIACEWLQSITPTQIFPTRGRITATTRRHWGLETVIPEIRIRAGLPVFTTRAFDGIATPIEIEKGQEVGVLLSGKFEELKKYWEGHSPKNDQGPYEWIPTIDKRRDHRHHLIDALAIALTTRSYAQKLSVLRKRNSDVLPSEYKGNFDLMEWLKQYPPGMPQHRDKALSMIESATIRRKSDRHVSGQLLEETAYARRGNVIGSRSKLVMLKESDLENIIDPETREAVIAQVNAYKSGALGDKPLSYAQAIIQPIYHRFIDGEGKGTQIKSVLVARTDLPGNSPSLVEVKNEKNLDRPFIYKSGGNAYLEVDKMGKAEVVQLVKAQNANHKPHSYGHETLRRIFANDLVREIDNDGQFIGSPYIVTSLKGGSGAPTLRLALVTETLTFGSAEKISKDLKAAGVQTPLIKTVSGKSLRKWVVVDS